MRILITGKQGFLGTELFGFLGHYHSVFGGKIDVLEYDQLEAFKGDVDLVIHLAAIVGTDRCLADPVGAAEVNVAGSLNVARFCKEASVRMINFSTTAVFAPTDNVIDEYSDKNPQTWYGITKYAGERIVKRILPTEQLVTVLPCFVYGGKADTHSAVKKICENALADKETHVLLNPYLKKDYLYVKDFVIAINVIIEQPALHGDFIVSAESPAPFERIPICVDKSVGKYCYVIYHAKADYLGNHCPSSRKLRDVTGWIPEYTLEEGINEVVKELVEA